MIARLDAHPDAHGQLMEIVRHYGRMAQRREDDRLLELAPRMMSDQSAMKEFAEAMERRAQRTGRTAAEEGHRWRRRNEDRLQERSPTKDRPPPVAGRRSTEPTQP